MADQQELLERCLNLRSNLCLQRNECEKLLEEAPEAWEVEQLMEFRRVRDEVADQIQQLDRHLSFLQNEEVERPEPKQKRPWFLFVFAMLFLLLVIAL